MRTSDQINELATSLAKAQGGITAARLDASNPHLSSKYTTLAAVWDVIRKPLSDNGLSIVQVVGMDDTGMVLTTRLMHSSGQFIEAVYPITANDGRGINGAQALGSALTYARRYSLAALVGVVSDEDDDGNGAGDQKARGQQRQQARTNGKPATNSAPDNEKPAQPANGSNGAQHRVTELEQFATTYSDGTPVQDAYQPEPGEPWRNWTGRQDAIDWAMAQTDESGKPLKNGYEPAFLKSWANLQKDRKLNTSDMYEPWFEKINLQLAEANAKISHDLDAQAAAEALEEAYTALDNPRRVIRLALGTTEE